MKLRKFLRRHWKATLLLSLILVLLTGFLTHEKISHDNMPDTPTVYFHYGAEPETAVVFLGGAGASPSAQVAEMLPVLKKRGNVFVVEYAPLRFTPSVVIDEVLQRVDGYKKVILVGASMGGLLAHDVIHQARKQGETRHFGVVLIDAPTQSSEVNMFTGLKSLADLALGSWSNALISLPREQTDINTIRPRNVEKLHKLWESYDTWATSCWADQGAFIFGHDELSRLTNVNWSFVQSEADEFIEPSAYASWVEAQGPMNLHVVPKAKHVSFLDWPDEYDPRLDAALLDVALR